MRLRAHITLFEARRRCDDQNILAENGYTITCMGSKMGIGHRFYQSKTFNARPLAASPCSVCL